MRTDYQMMLDVYEETGQDSSVFQQSDVAHLVIHENEVIGANLVPGLNVDPEETDKGVNARIEVEEGAVIDQRVHLCFGVLPEEGRQEIDLDVDIADGGAVDILAHCVFPNARDVTHLMDARIEVGAGAIYSYYEQHVHGPGGGVTVVPEAEVILRENARFNTEFELIGGRVGQLDIDYETFCGPGSSMRMLARIDGQKDDRINISEIGHLEGRGSRGALISRVALHDEAVADIYNELTARGDNARGHVDCKEIVQDDSNARATPVVDVKNPSAHVTHEAAIGSVDSKQLQTLLARGMEQEKAVETIIQGLLSARPGDHGW